MQKITLWKNGEEKRLTREQIMKCRGELFKLTNKLRSKGFFASELISGLNSHITEEQNIDIYLRLIKKTMRKYSKGELSRMFWTKLVEMKNKNFKKFG